MPVFTIALDSVPATAANHQLAKIEGLLTRSPKLGDIWLGLDREGVVTVAADIEARTFTDAVEIARREIPAALAAAGLQFEIDRARSRRGSQLSRRGTLRNTGAGELYLPGPGRIVQVASKSGSTTTSPVSRN